MTIHVWSRCLFLRTFVCCSVFACSLLLLPYAAQADPLASYYAQRAQSLAEQSFLGWQRASAMAARSMNSRRLTGGATGGGSGSIAAAREEAIKNYLEELIPATQPAAEVSHIPAEHRVQVDTSKPDRIWTAYYEKAKNGLRPHVEYQFRSNTHIQKAGRVTLSEAHVENLRDNFDVLMWYRNELESQIAVGQHQADERFKLFLDYFVADVLRSLPSAPRIRIGTGSVDAPKWEIDERQLREQLVMAYRYLVAKFQIHAEYEEFGPADRQLLMTMMKIALLMGADFHPQWFQEKEVNLTAVTEKTKWKTPMAQALETLQAESEDDDMPIDEQVAAAAGEEPCIITIPQPRAKAAKTAPRPRPEKKPDFEIIIRPKE